MKSSLAVLVPVLKLIAVLITASGSFSSFGNVQVQHLDICDVSAVTSNTVNVSLDQFSHWDHSQDQKYGLILAKKKHNTNNQPCPSLFLSLIKQRIRNKHQHLTGLEFKLVNSNITFAELDSLLIKLKVNTSANNAVTVQQRINLQHHNVSNATIDKLFSNSTMLKLVLYGAHHSNINEPTIYASHLFQISKDDINNWLTVELNKTDFLYSRMANWRHSSIASNQLANKPIVGGLIMAETPSTRTLESLVGEKNISAVPESLIIIPTEIQYLLLKKVRF